MENNFKVHQLWATPIYENYIPVEDNWVNFVKSEDYKRMASGNGDITKDYYILEKLPDLKKEIENHINLFVEKYLKVNKDVSFYLTNSWIIQHHPNDHAQSHFHTNSLLSGVYYLDVPKNSGDIRFLRMEQMHYVFPSSFNINYSENTYQNCYDYPIDTTDGKILIFPSHINHGVWKNETNEKRYSLSFNVYARGKVGEHECQLELK
jgi:uncharacterized protein (TIGR02466 family)